MKLRLHKARRTCTLAALLCLSLSALAADAQAPSDDEVTPQVQALYAQAKAAQEKGDNAEAIEKYRAMLRLAPHLAPAYNNLGRLYFNERDYEHAAQVLKHGLELNPNMPTASTLLGMSYHEMGDDAQAEPLLEGAVRANPNDDNLQIALARTLVDLGNYEAATPYLRSYLERNPKDQQAWYLLGSAYTGTIDTKQEGDKMTYIIPPGTKDAFQKCIDLGADNTIGQQCKQTLDGLAAMGGGEDTSVGKRAAKKKS
jgi:tetratricopeptide (TPR) repeat protein